MGLMLLNSYHNRIRISVIAACSAILMGGCSENIDRLTNDNISTNSSEEVSQIGEESENRFGQSDLLRVSSEAEPEEVELNTKQVLFSQIGYESASKKYIALRDNESEPFRLVDVNSIDSSSEVYGNLVFTDNLFEQLRCSVSSNSASKEDRIIDALITYELFLENQDDGEAADELKTAKTLISGLSKKYDYKSAALCALFAYCYNDMDSKLATEYRKMSEEIFLELEKEETDWDLEGRFFAAAELYKLTGNSSYRQIVDETDIDAIYRGFSFENPGAYGILAYLLTKYRTDINTSERFMRCLFQDAIDIISTDPDELYNSLCKEEPDMAVKKAYENMRLLVLVNSVSQSVDYANTCCLYFDYLSGMNPYNEQYITYNESETSIEFVLTGLSQFYRPK